MSAPYRPAGASGFVQPPFLAVRGRKERRRGWWSGVTARGKAAVLLSAGIAAALAMVLVFSAGAGNRAPSAPEPGRAPARAGLSLAGESLLRNLEALRVSLISSRLKSTLDFLSSIAPEVERKLGELSRVVQGGRCGVYLAALPQASDAGRAGLQAPGGIPEDPEGIWRYANGLADSYLPDLKSSTRELRRLRADLLEAGVFTAFRSSRGLLLQCCNLQLSGTRSLVRALELVRDLNEMTAGEALELAQWAVRDLGGGTARLHSALEPLAISE